MFVSDSVQKVFLLLTFLLFLLENCFLTKCLFKHVLKTCVEFLVPSEVGNAAGRTTDPSAVDADFARHVGFGNFHAEVGSPSRAAVFAVF